MAWVMLFLPVALLVLGFPFFVVLLATSATVLLFFSDIPVTALHQVMFGTIDQFALLAVPFFIFAGELMARGNISAPLVRWALSLVGGLRGSLGLTTLGAATVFGAISGATTAAVAAVGSLTYEPLNKAGYGERFSAGLLASAGAIANILPPSIAMILYGAVSHTSVVALFAAGIVPGLLLAAFFAVYVYLYAVRRGLREGTGFAWAEFLAATRNAAWAFGAPVVILGGIYGGIFTPTEAAGVACVYSIFVTMLVYRSLGLRQIFEIAGSSMYLTAQIFIIVAAAGTYSWLLTVSGAAHAAVGFVASLALPPWGVLLAINVFLLLVGCVLDTASAILVLTPLLGAIAAQIGVDPVHFGIIMVFNLSIGTFTPPFGLNIFVAQAVFKVPLAELYAGLMPFIAISIAALFVITYVPALSLWILRFL
jgi:C4-dicarboxylate transporter, DctM subunit